MTDTSGSNPLLTPSELPYRFPPFERIEEGHYAAALETGLQEQLAEIDVITSNPEPADFENTAVAMERSGRILDRAARAFYTLVSADASALIRRLETEVTPKVAAHQDAIYLNRSLYERFAAIDTAALDAESARLVAEYFVSSASQESSWIRAHRNDFGCSTPNCPGWAPSSGSEPKRP